MNKLLALSTHSSFLVHLVHHESYTSKAHDSIQVPQVRMIFLANGGEIYYSMIDIYFYCIHLLFIYMIIYFFLI